MAVDPRRNFILTGLAVLSKDVLPGIPLTRIMPLERLVSESLRGGEKPTS